MGLFRYLNDNVMLMYVYICVLIENCVDRYIWYEQLCVCVSGLVYFLD